VKSRHDHLYRKQRKTILANDDICALCGFPVDKQQPYWVENGEARIVNPLAPTIDHIVPIRKGGSINDINNLQLAHWKCNNAKRDKLLIRSQKSDNPTEPMDWGAILSIS
jgi:5-methylcytosine-specific restriction endonuclease McrA